jgi:hypothetical protein
VPIAPTEVALQLYCEEPTYKNGVFEFFFFWKKKIQGFFFPQFYDVAKLLIIHKKI